LKPKLTYLLLMGIKLFSALCYRFHVCWLGNPPADPWANLRLVVLLNHTSLYEPLFVGILPLRFLKNIARNGLVPVADKTMCRPLVGRFFRLVAHNVVSISRLRDRTWESFLTMLKSSSLVVVAPEGRMKRANGLDLEGKPMTVRGGIADLLDRMKSGRMLIAYSGGLHHVQIPNQRIPRLFKTLTLKIENLDIAQYKDALLDLWGPERFKQGVIRDLEMRRTQHCGARAR
jgi:1-acyl-sn-glycerol-3-phosphate acyltransferase